MSYSGGDMNTSSISNLASHVTEAVHPVQPPTEDQKALIQAVKAVNAAEPFGQDNELTFIINRAANIAVVRIVNKKTGELVEQIPTEDVLRMAEERNGR
jgi:uncharacterized FlaG/YvyC family protein